MFGNATELRRPLRLRLRSARYAVFISVAALLVFALLVSSLNMAVPYGGLRAIGTFLSTVSFISNVLIGLVWAVAIGGFVFVLVTLSPYVRETP